MLATSTAKVGEVEPHRPIASLTQVDAAGIATPTSAFLATMSPSSRPSSVGTPPLQKLLASVAGPLAPGSRTEEAAVSGLQPPRGEIVQVCAPGLCTFSAWVRSSGG
jgi:hypothetical protein